METGFSLGSNKGNRLANLSAAKKLLLDLPGVRSLGASPVYETDPVGVKPEHAHLRYLNAALIVDSPRTSREWIEEVGQIETRLGRVRTEDRFAPRTIDIDILYCGETCIDSEGLVVPHPRWAERRFVVQPLADLRPNLVLPGGSQSVRDILEQLPEGEKVELFEHTW